MFAEFGGIYLDADVIVLKSFNPLRRYQTTMGRESSIGVCNGIMASAKGAPFTRILLEQYDSYSGDDEAWGYRSVLVPHTLSRLFSSYIHIEEKSLNRPNWQELNEIYKTTYNWSGNYAIHLWVRLQVKEDTKRVPESVAEIDCVDNTIGEIGRYVYYGSKWRRIRCPLKFLKNL